MQVNWKRAMNLVGCDWLDVISFEEINSINEAEKQHRPLECFSTETNGNNLAQAVQWTNQWCEKREKLKFYFWLDDKVTKFAKPVTLRHLNEPLEKTAIKFEIRPCIKGPK